MFVSVISRNSSWSHRQIWLVLSTLLPFVGSQRMDEAEGEGLKAQLLTNLNRYSGHGSRAAEGPMESLGASHGAPGSPMPPLPAELPADPISSLLALFRPPPSFAVPPLPPLIPPTPATFAPPFTANFQQILSKNRPPPALSERRFLQQKSSTAPAAFSPRSFPIGELKTEKGKWNRTAAEVIGEWRRRMYKVLKSARKQRSREKKANSRERENISAVEEQQHHRHEHRQHHQHQHQQQPLVLFGPPPAVIDVRRANKLAKLFGVENAHNGTTRRGLGTPVPLRKNLRSSELRTMDGGRRTATLPPPPPKGDEGDADLYTDLLDGEEEQKHLQDVDGGDERFEIVYVPALKTKRKLLKAKTTTSDGQTEESAEQTKRQKAFGPFNGQTPRTSLFPSSTPDTAAQAAPNVPQLPQPNAVADPPPPPPPPTVPMLPLAVPSGLLPLQFPTLLPPIVPSLTVVPPPPVQLSGRIAKPSPSLTTLSSLPQSPEGDYLKELENVSEDYVDEQERRLPCLRDRSDAAFPSGGGRPFLHGSNPPGCQKPEKAVIGREFAVKTPSTGLFFEAPEDSSGGAPIRHILWDENKEMCNSARLRTLIQKSVVPSNVEKSKRRLQQSAEQQFGTFYNVICWHRLFQLHCAHR
ncbi:hypothetical protein GPALN_016354 [Globodera pallida]|nr:hypothetical protein GPALN_016354 [Globodera pallida]